MLENGIKCRIRLLVSKLIFYRKRPVYIFKRLLRYGLSFSSRLAEKVKYATYRIARHKINSLIGRLSKLINAIKKKFDEDQVFTEDSVLIMDILKHEGAEKAVEYLQKKHQYIMLDVTRFLIQLYQYAAKIEKSEEQYWCHERVGNKVVLHFCCWGESYRNKVIKYMLPSLLASGNFPWLSEGYNVSLLIHCDNITKQEIVTSIAYKTLGQYAKISFHVFPDSLMKLYHAKTARISSIYPQIRYLLLGVCQTHAFKVGLNNQAFLSYLMPDVVLSDNFYRHAFSKIASKKIVFTTTYRSNFMSSKSQLDTLYQAGDDECISISADKLLMMQIEHIHPFELKRIVSTATNNFSPSARLIFKNDNGFILRCFHYHPAIINCQDISRDIRLDYLPIDNTVLNNIFEPGIPHEHQAWVCTVPSDMAIMELSDEEPEMEVLLNQTTLSYDQMVSQVQNLLMNAPAIFDSPLNRFLVEFRHEFQVAGYENPMGESVENIDDVKFMSEVYRGLEDNQMDLTA